MNERAQMIKTAIMLELAKEGKTLQDLESAMNAAKLEKEAGNMIFDPASYVNAAKSLFSLGGASALGLGALGGTGVYAALRANEDSSDQILKKMKEKQQYDDAAKAIQSKMKHPTIM